MQTVRESKKVIFATWGSYGDLHPFMGLALEMQTRGHRTAIATLPLYREKVEAAGIQFYPVRPDTPAPDTKEAQELIRRVMDLRDGPRYVMAELMSPYIRQTYEDTVAAVDDEGGADLLVSHAVPLAAPLVAAKLGVPWVSAVLSPISLTSVYDPPTPPEFPWLRRLMLLNPIFAKTFIRILKKLTESWVAPVRELRKELGLPRSGHPMFEGQHSPERVLAVFSKVLVKMQPDYPANTTITGFSFYDRDAAETPARELMQFLEAGEPPIVFTLGSAAVRVGQDFFRTSIDAARRLKRRALLLVSDSGDLAAHDPANGIGVFTYAPHSVVMPRGSVVVHQAGIGTTGQALRAGRPVLIVPHGQDQPDNARRCAELGVGLVMSGKQYNVANAVVNLRRLLDEPDFTERARVVAEIVKAEHGARTACDALESSMRTNREMGAGTKSKPTRPAVSWQPNPWRWEHMLMARAER